jgi:glycosyltransferase involved in cell wall biosynthesis
MKVLWLASHPIQYQAPLFRELARRCDLLVAFAHRQTAAQQGEAGYGVAFDWDVDLLSGYRSVFLRPSARQPSIERFWQCRSDEVAPLIEREKFDAVVLGGWNLYVYWQALAAARRRGIPTLVRTDSRSPPGEPAWRRALRRLAYPTMLGRLSGFLAAGTQSTRYLINCGVLPERIFTCPHTVDVARFGGGRAPAFAERAALRAQLGLRGEARVVVFVGRLIALKRPLDACAAIARLPEPRSHELVYVGEGPLAGAIEREARRLGVTAHMTGFRNQSGLPAWLQASNVLVLPSESETWGMVANEALAAGCPVILSDAVGGATDLGAFAPAVQVYPCGDTEALAASLQRAAGADPAAVQAVLDAAVASFAPAKAADLCIAALAASCGQRA